MKKGKYLSSGFVASIKGNNGDTFFDVDAGKCVFQDGKWLPIPPKLPNNPTPFEVSKMKKTPYKDLNQTGQDRKKFYEGGYL